MYNEAKTQKMIAGAAFNFSVGAKIVIKNKMTFEVLSRKAFAHTGVLKRYYTVRCSICNCVQNKIASSLEGDNKSGCGRCFFRWKNNKINVSDMALQDNVTKVAVYCRLWKAESWNNKTAVAK